MECVACAGCVAALRFGYCSGSVFSCFNGSMEFVGAATFAEKLSHAIACVNFLTSTLLKCSVVKVDVYLSPLS